MNASKLTYVANPETGEITAMNAETFKLYQFLCALPADLQSRMREVIKSASGGKDFASELEALRKELEVRKTDWLH